MEKFKQLIPPLLVLVLLLSSCTINHPLYTSNYRIEWKNSNKQTFDNSNAQNKIHSQNNLATAITSEQEDTSFDRSTDIHENNIASTDRSMIILPAKKFDVSKTMAALTKKKNATNYANAARTKIDDKKLNPLKRNYRKTKGILKALYLLILVLILGALALFFISLFGIFFLLAAITAGIIILIFGTLVILGL